MQDEIINKNLNEIKSEIVADVSKISNVVAAEEDFKDDNKKSFKRSGGRGGNSRPRQAKEKPEYDSKTIDVRRVTRVVTGGRRFSLAISMAIGNRKGKVGLGDGKSLDTQLAIEKATRDAKKHLITLNLTKDNSIPFDVKAKYKSAIVWLTPNKGKGIVAGSSARTILSLAGINNVTAKFHSGTKNKINNAKAVLKALETFTR